jgi:hypothetical protein
MGTAVRSRARRGAVGIVVALLASLVVAAGSMGGEVTIGDGSRSEVGTDLLQQARRALENAEDRAKAGGEAYGKPVRLASKALKTFITWGFDRYEYFDTCNTRILLNLLLEIDADVGRGYFEQGSDRVGSLDEALSGARNVVVSIEGCAPGFESRADDLLSSVRRLIRLHEDGKVADQAGQRGYANLRTRIHNDNRNLITSAPDQVKGGCEIPGVYRSLEIYIGWVTNGVMTSPEFLLDFKRPKNAKQRRVADAVAERVRRSSAQQAQTAVTGLLRDWKECSPADCADAEDNDGDGSIDVADLGCAHSSFSNGLDVDDRSEEASEVPSSICPPVGVAATGQSPSAAHLINANSGDELLRWSVFDADTGQVLLAMDDDQPGFTAGESASLGDSLCGPGTSATVRWRVEGTRVTWDFTVLKGDPDVAPRPSRIVVAGNTR